MRKLLIAAPAFVLGCLLTASLTTVARAKDPAPAKAYDYVVVYSPEDLVKYGRKGYAIVSVSPAHYSGASVFWTLQRK